MSFVFPGAGQLYLGRRISAVVFAVPALLAILWAVLQLSHGLVYFALSMLDSGYALTVAAVAAAFTAWRMASIVHPFVVVRPRRIGRRAVAALALLLVATLGTGDVVFSNAVDAYGAAQQMSTNNFADATASPTPAPSASPSPSPSPSVAQGESASPAPSATPVISPSSSPTWGRPDPNRLTVLLTGVDFMQGRSHALNDTLILVSINLKTRAVAMVSVPRDTSNFSFYWGGQAPLTFKINSLVNAIAAGQFGSPDTPMVTLANEVGFLVGVSVNYYAEIDMDGFSKLIDLVGGVNINNPTLLNDPSTGTCIPAGPVHLDGTTALQYVRSRETTNDYARANRQQIVMVALEKKLATPAMLPQLGSLLALAGQSIATNFPLNMARDYVSVAQHPSSLSQCVLGPPYNYHPDSSLTGGTWTSRLLLDKVASLSVQLFGTDSRYYGQPGVVPASCQATVSSPVAAPCPSPTPLPSRSPLTSPSPSPSGAPGLSPTPLPSQSPLTSPSPSPSGAPGQSASPLLSPSP
jgi:LCP family protein required for cell wall assembly